MPEDKGMHIVLEDNCGVHVRLVIAGGDRATRR